MLSLTCFGEKPQSIRTYLVIGIDESNPAPRALSSATLRAADGPRLLGWRNSCTRESRAAKFFGQASTVIRGGVVDDEHLDVRKRLGEHRFHGSGTAIARRCRRA